jgi:hypothetical protein
MLLRHCPKYFTGREKKLPHKLHTAFADPWKLVIIEDTISITCDSHFSPSGYLLRAGLILPGTAGRAIINFASNYPRNSVLYNYSKNSIIKALEDSTYPETWMKVLQR